MDERMKKISEMMEKHPEYFPKPMQDAIKQGKVVEGMTPHQAHLAGGAYFFRVIPDPEFWEQDADPYIVMQAQSTRPDKSQIWMTFQNTTQYSGTGIQTFQVTFEQGKVTDVKNIQQETA